MSATGPAPSNTQNWQPFEEALLVLLDDWRASGKCSQSDRALILALASKLAPHRRALLLQDFGEELSARSRRGGPVFENVVRLINERSEWTANNLRRTLNKNGHSVDAKTLSNCLNYLVKSGRLVRISRGHYAVAGHGVVTSDELFPSHDISKGGENED